MSNPNGMPVAPSGASSDGSSNDAKKEQSSAANGAVNASSSANVGGAHSVGAAASTNAAGSSAAATGSSTSNQAGGSTSFAPPKAEDAVNVGANPAGSATAANSATGTSNTTAAGATGTAGTIPAQATAQAQAKFAQQQNKAKKANQQKSSGLGKAFAGGIVGAVVVALVFICLWQFTPIFGTKSSTATNTGGTITINGDTEATVAEAVGAKDLSSVVTIYVYSSTSSDWSQLFGNNSSSNSSSPSALGSGVIVKKDDTYSYIVTNYHVVENTTRAVVSVGDTQVEAESVGYDSKSDLAVLKIKKTDTTVAEWGDSSNLHVGQWVAAIGSPYGYEQTLTTGIVSALYRSDVLSSSSSSSSSSIGGTTVYTDMIQTDAAINPGNSGGGLFDSEGKLVGINTYISSTSQSSAGLGFAIPQASAQSAVETLISGQTVTHPFLGVALGSSTSSTNTTGATVAAVYKDTAAAEAGLKTGDIITKIDDKTMSSSSDVTKAVAAKKVGDEITITYTRDGKEATTKAKLGDDSGTHTEYADGGAPAGSSNSGNSGSGNGYNYNFGNSGNSGNGNSGNGNSGNGNSGSGNSGSGNSGSGSSNLFDYLWGNK